jgi:glycine/D-amino acid oxidase-like deaminating enzyme
LNWIAGVHPPDAAAARRIYDFTRAGIDLVERLARDHAPAAGFTRNGSLEVYTDERRAEGAARSVTELAAAGVPLRWLDRREVRLRGAVGAILDPLAGQANGLALLRGLRGPLEGRGVAIHEDTPVRSVEEGASIRLVTPRGEVRAPVLVLATNAYSPALGYFRESILPLHSHVFASEPLPAQQWQQIGWGPADGFSDDLDRIAFGCRTASGRIVFGGGSNAAYDYRFGGGLRATADEGAFRAMRRTLEGYVPDAAGLALPHRWSGLLDLTFDRAPSIGVRGEARNVFYAIGYSGHGFTLGMLAGQVLCDLYAGEHDPWRSFAFHQRPLPWIPSEPLRWIGYQLYSRATGRSPRRR